MQSNNRIKKISVRGTNAAGQFEIDTDLMKMKHYLSVNAESVTNEVNSEDFFTKAQGFIDETRNKNEKHNLNSNIGLFCFTKKSI